MFQRAPKFTSSEPVIDFLSPRCLPLAGAVYFLPLPVEPWVLYILKQKQLHLSNQALSITFVTRPVKIVSNYLVIADGLVSRLCKGLTRFSGAGGLFDTITLYSLHWLKNSGKEAIRDEVLSLFCCIAERCLFLGSALSLGAIIPPGTRLAQVKKQVQHIRLSEQPALYCSATKPGFLTSTTLSFLRDRSQM